MIDRAGPGITQRSKNGYVVYSDLFVQASRCGKLCKGAADLTERNVCMMNKSMILSLLGLGAAAAGLLFYRLPMMPL